MKNEPIESNRRTAIRNAAINWWVRLDADGDDADLQLAWQQWLAEDLAHEAAFAEISHLWGELGALKPQVPPLGWVATNPKIRTRRSQAIWKYAPLAMAAAVLLFCFSPLWVWLQADYQSPVGASRSIHLNDGSTVILNSDSALAVSMNAQTRELSLLKGEAWFQVSPDPQRPFRVHAGEGAVTALGTAFNIHVGEGQTEITVTEHRVAVDLDSGATTTNLQQGERVVYNRHAISPAEPVDTEAATAWQRGKLVFENRPLGDVLAELNRYHHGYFTICDSALAQRRVNGVFRTDQPLAVIDALQHSLKLHSTRLGGYWVILHQ
ncbi:FecR family protein [Methylovulum miyakonense]|uniref:FecR family protein n=1 Tax=Methylovulum miyakonense TaxID=645578 RepID=UPI00035FD7ED|nr:FecR family protein [Methylovulum miyakonense]